MLKCRKPKEKSKQIKKATQIIATPMDILIYTIQSLIRIFFMFVLTFQGRLDQVRWIEAQGDCQRWCYVAKPLVSITWGAVSSQRYLIVLNKQDLTQTLFDPTIAI